MASTGSDVNVLKGLGIPKGKAHFSPSVGSVNGAKLNTTFEEPKFTPFHF